MITALTGERTNGELSDNESDSFTSTPSAPVHKEIPTPQKQKQQDENSKIGGFLVFGGLAVLVCAFLLSCSQPMSS